MNTHETTPSINLLDYDLAGLTELVVARGEPSFRATQLFSWIHQAGVSSFDEMTNLSKKFRAELATFAHLSVPKVIYRQHSKDGTRKWLLQLDTGNSIETVFIPEDDRGTLCVSSQVGCALNCSFCSTAQQGFNRNLTTAEIIGQVWAAVRELSREDGRHDRRITNVVMMGMGEPLLNFDNVVKAMSIMMDDFAYGLSKRRVTLSTSGVVPEMNRLSMVSDCSLAVSLHAPNDALRNELVPINKKYPIKELMVACKNFFKDEPRRKVTFEYVMLDGVNDQLTHAKQLARLLEGVPAKINLIPFNPFPGTRYNTSSKGAIERFKAELMHQGYNVTVRKTRGDDIDAACGQLVGKVEDKTRRQERLQKLKIPVIIAQTDKHPV